MLNVGPLAKAIDFAEWAVWVKTLKFQKIGKNRFFNYMKVLPCKKQLGKNTNIPEMRRF